MPIPYMGSKRKSVDKIYNTITNFSDKKVIYDLFTGGFAIGEHFYKKGFKVIANDKNKYVVALLREAIKGLDESIVTKFVSRDLYLDVQKNKENYDDWYVGFIQCIYSFGNNQTCYSFSKDNEKIKYAGHEIVINKNPDELLKLFPEIPENLIEGIIKQSDWHKRRIALIKVSKILNNRKFKLEQLERLERLERLQQLEQLERLELYSNNYFNIEIENDSIIYCDPPYEGTASYAEGGFNHSDFWDWCRKQSLTNDVFISEYKAPDDFISILKFSQKSTLQGGLQKHNNQPCENLFIHKSFYDRKFKLKN